MILPIQITFRTMEPSAEAEEWIRKEAGKLDEFYNRIMACRVVVELPSRHRRFGSLYHVRIDLTVPGGELVVKREPCLQDYARRQRRHVKTHEPALQARISKLFPEEGYGFLETLGGREIYFHKN